MAADTPLVSVRDLRIGFPRRRGGDAEVVRGVSFELREGETLGLVGESGSGKTIIASSLLDLVPAPGRITGGQVLIGGVDVVTMDVAARRRLRGGTVGMVFQDPLSGLNPVRTIGSMLVESLRRHGDHSKGSARDVAEAALRAVGIPAAHERLRAYPHELSGGLRQRVMIALALLNHPRLIIADEPTTALDTTIQAQILDLLRSRIATAGLILITHDLGVAAQTCQRIAVVYHGRIVEHGATDDVLSRPRHPYTAGLLAAVPRFESGRERLVPIPGSPPPAIRPIEGCAFAARCPRVAPRCTVERPPLEVAVDDATATGRPHSVACWFPEVAVSDMVHQ